MLDSSPHITAASKFAKARDVLEGDHRWGAVDAREREEVFNEYIKERDRRERETRRNEAKKREEGLRALFERTGVVVRVAACGCRMFSWHVLLHVRMLPLPLAATTALAQVGMTWRKALARMDRAPEFEACDKLERLEVFCDYMRALERAERDARDEARTVRRRQERLNRDAFKQLLQQHLAEGRIHAKTTWKVRSPSDKQVGS